MIQVEALSIENFRGIRKLRLDLGSESFVVVGPNGTGKSGIVDALEFVLTGSVSRLAGPGSGDLSLMSHAPHVLSSGNPEAAVVSVEIRETVSGELATLSRSVDSHTRFVLDPDTEVVRAAVERIGCHPEVVLSRREIVKFILTQPSERAKAVRDLLRLEDLGRMRSSLRSAVTQLNSLVSGATTKLSTANDNLARLFDSDVVDDDALVTALSERRVTLGLAPLTSLDLEDVSLGIVGGQQAGTVNRATALRDIDALSARIGDDAPAVGFARILVTAMAPIVEDPVLAGELQQKDLVDAGLALIVSELCPLCDHAWSSADDLRSHLAAKVERLAHAQEVASTIESAGHTLAEEINGVVDAISNAHSVANGLEQAAVADALAAWQRSLRDMAVKLANVEGALSLGTQVSEDPLAIPTLVLGLVDALRSTVESLPDVSARTEATSFLTLAQERLAGRKSARAELEVAASAARTAEAVYEAYCSAQDGVLGQLYESVAETFAQYYGSMNSDEDGFTAELVPVEQRLNLLVDFYALGMYPPAAYHSEGHQDGMGVCLYLALMKHLLGDDFNLAVLDDVVMSVDAGHRRKFCKLLKDEFPDVQFIITTHDRLWAEELIRSKLVSRKRQLRISRWDVESGPWVASGVDLWDEIEAELNDNKVPQAAAVLRHNLEWILSDLADHYQCPIPYSATATYDLGEYLTAIKPRFKGLLSKAADSASSWNDEEAAAKVAEFKTVWSAASLAQETEQWMINPAVHFNEWATFTKADFEPVVEAWKEFLDIFECSICDTRFYVTKSDGKDDSLRCECTDTNLNLRRMP